MKARTLLAIAIAGAFALPLTAGAQSAASGTGVDRTNTPTTPTPISPEGSPPATTAGRAPVYGDRYYGNDPRANVPHNGDLRNPSSGDGAGGTTAGSGTDPQLNTNRGTLGDRASAGSSAVEPITGNPVTTAPATGAVVVPSTGAVVVPSTGVAAEPRDPRNPASGDGAGGSTGGGTNPQPATNSNATRRGY